MKATTVAPSNKSLCPGGKGREGNNAFHVENLGKNFLEDLDKSSSYECVCDEEKNNNWAGFRGIFILEIQQVQRLAAKGG